MVGQSWDGVGDGERLLGCRLKTIRSEGCVERRASRAGWELGDGDKSESGNWKSECEGEK